MTQHQAEKAANVVIGLAAVAAVISLFRFPATRRAVWQATRTALGATGPWLMAEARQAWNASRATIDVARSRDDARSPAGRPVSADVGPATAEPAARQHAI